MKPLLMSLVALLVFGMPVVAMERTWTGNVDSDWFVAGNWDPPDDHPKIDEAAVINSGTVVLTNATEALLSLTVGDGATLVFSNWITQVEAHTVVLESGSMVTLPDPFTEDGMSNRIRFVVNNFTLEQGATIDVEGRGFTESHGDGKGVKSGNEAAGAGYGGYGGASIRASVPGAPYGSLTAPNEPGSGGVNGGNTTSYVGGPGGGLVQVIATGTVTINGTINADGIQTGSHSSGPRGGGGSGGGIFIQCDTFGGTASGLLRANGGSGEMSTGARSNVGAGGGGRIAVIYESLAGSPAVRFSAKPGPLGFLDVDLAFPYPVPFKKAAQPGTLYFPDLTLPNSVLEAHGSPAGLQGMLYWETSETLTFSGLTVTNAYFAISPSNTVEITGDLVIGTNAVLMLGSHFNLDVSGNLTIENSGSLQVYAGDTNGVSAYGALVQVGGTMTVQSNAWVYPFSHSLNGGSVKFALNNLTIAEGGGFDASVRGYSGGARQVIGYGPGGGGSSSNEGGGGGYGGKGGNSGNNTPGGSPYPSPHVPYLPGSGGAGSSTAANFGGSGGGLIWIEASGQVLLDGSLVADGGGTTANTRGGAGSGGGIFVAADTISGGSSALLSVDGGDGVHNSSGGGGGGRIALWQGVPESIRNEYLLGNTNAVFQDVTAGFYNGDVSFSWGTGAVHPPDPNGAADGTAFFYSLMPIRGSMFIFR